MTDTPEQPDALAARVGNLERRVQELEALLVRSGQPDGARAADTDTVPDEDDTFWALDGLRRRVPDPGAVLITGSVTLPDGRVARWQQGAATEDLLGPDFAEHAESLAVLGHPVRLTILHRLLGGAASVQDLAGSDGLGTSGQIYHHLRQLVAAGWLRAIGGARYEVPAQRVVPLLAVLLGASR